jgi:hypothetical protein
LLLFLTELLPQPGDCPLLLLSLPPPVPILTSPAIQNTLTMMDDYLQFVVHWLDDPEPNSTVKKEIEDNYGEDCKFLK